MTNMENDCHSLELFDWHLSRNWCSMPAALALEQVLIARFDTLGRIPTSFLIHSNNVQVEYVAITLRSCAVAL
jgi:hypothetical protein